MPRDKSSWQPSSQKRQKQPKQQGSAQSNAVDKESYLQDDAIPINLQQSLLNVFRDAYNKTSASEIEETLQEVKGHLYNRDFATAFGKDEYLEAYAARWSPSRALGYAQIFSDLTSLVTDCVEAMASESGPKNQTSRPETDTGRSEPGITTEEPSGSIISDMRENGTSTLSDNLRNSLKLEEGSSGRTPLNIVCLGGGAGAEVVGLAGWFRHLIDLNVSPSPTFNTLNILGIDIARWNTVMHCLHQHITTAPTLSKYASAAAKASNSALLSPDTINVDFKEQDLLSTSSPELTAQLKDPSIVTLMFTLNELYTTSVPSTQRLLYTLTSALKPGALLLVVDSPGSYSTVTLNGAEKKYPMQWLLDHTLLSNKDGLKWEKLVSDESRWFRLPKAGLKYPIELENMRYQIHVYRRCGGLP